MGLYNPVNVSLFIEDIEEYIDVSYIKFNIHDESSPYMHNISINIECIFDENIFSKALIALKYESLIYESNNYGVCSKKDMMSDVIVYISKIDSNNLLKFIELKNVIITSINYEEESMMLTCDYYIKFNDFLEIDDKEYLENIYRIINIKYKPTYNTMPYLGIPFDHTRTKEINNNEEDYEEIYDDYGEDMNNKEDNEDIFEKSGKLISKIFSSFYK